MKNKLVLAVLVFGGSVVGGFLARVLPALASHNNVVDTFDLVPFRGRLEKGDLPHSVAVQMTFSIYDAPANGNLLYVESFVSVQPDPDGNFAVVLGRNGHAADGTTEKTLRAALRGNNAYYVGVAVEGVALEGRQRLLAAPFAARVPSILSADIADAGVLAQHIAASQVGSSELADGGVGAQHLSSLGCNPEQIPVRSDMGTWKCDDQLPEISTPITLTGTTNVNTPPTNLHPDDGRTVCFLTRAQFYYWTNTGVLDTSNECEVLKSGGWWVLRAQNASSPGANSACTCSASCLTW